MSKKNENTISADSSLLNFREDVDKYKETMQDTKVANELKKTAKNKGRVVHFNELSKEAQSYNSRLGAMVTNEKRRKTTILAETMKTLLEMPLIDKDTIRKELSKRGLDDDMLTEATAICYTQMQRSKIDTRSFEVVRDTIGQKPVEKQAIISETETVDDIIRKHFS